MTRTRPKCIVLADWPRADQVAWQWAIQDGSVLDDRGPAAHWSAASRFGAQQGYGRWLAFLRDHHEVGVGDTGIDALDACGFAAFVTQLESELAPATVVTQVKWLSDAVRVMYPEREWSWLRSLTTQVSRRHRNGTRRRPPAVDSGRLLEVGLGLTRDAELNTTELDLTRAIRFRDGLMIALLASRPLRRRTLAAIHIDRQLQRIADRWWLLFGPEDTKSRRPLEFSWPQVLEPVLEQYLNHYRGGFPGADGSRALWLSAHGGALTAGTIQQRVSKATCDALGYPVPPHQFRHAVATTISRQDPEHVMTIAPILGHAGLNTAYGHYIQAGSREASRAYQAVIDRLGRRGTSHRKTRTRR